MEFIDQYMKFMYYRKNVEQCQLCPINEGKADGERKPCGEMVCVISTHLKEKRVGR